MAIFENAIYTLERMGVADVILPFLLVFTISFMALKQVPVLSSNKHVPTIIGLVLGLSVVFPHVTGNYSYSYGQDVVNIINESLPSVGLILVIIISILLLVGLLGFDLASFGGSALGGGLVIVSLLIVSAIFGESAGWFENFHLFDWVNPEVQGLLVTGAMFFIFIMLITGNSNPTKTWVDSIADFLRELTKKKP
ncbi:hypothetical protein J4418_02665 [Candidatus Woesearchaeota archaeon]|nr:hypothetical protein [Candidatus Woesearchaeota archaeon]